MGKLSRRDFLRWAGAGGFTAVGMIGIGEKSSEDLVVERRELRLSRWDAGTVRVAFLADVHVNDELATLRAARAVELALAEKPDVLLFGGDFVNVGTPSTLRNVQRAFDGLRNAPCPCIAVLGNHDYWVNDPAEVIAAVRSTSLRLLRNEAVDIGGITVFGVDDALNHRARPDLIRSDRHSRSLIALFHEPDNVDDVPDTVSLQLSGHSHGGQVCLPGGIALHTPKGALKYKSGYYADANAPLYVTRGVGTTGPNWRMFCPPEVTILRLKAV